MNDRLRAALAILISLTDAELATIQVKLPLVRRAVRDFEDEHTSAGLSDLDDESLVAATIAEMEDDLARLLRGTG